MKIIYNLLDIPKNKYTGYVWMSDNPIPKILENEIYNFSEINTNPFIIEANLFAKNENISVNIKHIDGKYFISIIDLNNIPEFSEIVKKNYLANSVLKPAEKLFFKECWQEIDDELCEKMKVLKPTWTAFVGFTNGGNENE